MNIRLMKVLDSVLGRILVTLLPGPSGRTASGIIDSVLIIRPGGIGDAVLLIPAIQALKQKYPFAKISILAEHRNGSVFNLCPDIDTILLYDYLPDLLQAVRGRYDVVIDTEQWHRLSAIVAKMTGCQALIGYGTNERSRLFNFPILYSHDDYETVSFLNLLEPLGVGLDSGTERFLAIAESNVAAVSTLLGGIGTDPFVAIFPGASISERRWGANRFSMVARWLSSLGVKVVVVGGKEDQQQGQTIVAGGVGLNLAGRTSLAETAAVIDRSALLLSGDSGVLHIAAGLGKPTVSLFGPGRAVKWAPRGTNHVVINKELPCSPCTTYGNTPKCTINAQCMKNITVEEVLNAVRMLLTSEGIIPSTVANESGLKSS